MEAIDNNSPSSNLNTGNFRPIFGITAGHMLHSVLPNALAEAAQFGKKSRKNRQILGSVRTGYGSSLT